MVHIIMIVTGIFQDSWSCFPPERNPKTKIDTVFMETEGWGGVRVEDR